MKTRFIDEPERQPEECLAQRVVHERAEVCGALGGVLALQRHEHERDEDGEPHLRLRRDALVAQ